jgi:prepilin-type N-terminal cleavage/methylation domain-containing protein
MTRQPLRPRAFTLIELLIVVAIIAILAAIAVPNFLEAQTRSKVSRARADMRTIAVGIESYVVDSNHLPLSPVEWPFRPGGPTGGIEPTGYKNIILASLTTPIAYISTFPTDPWGGDSVVSTNPGDTRKYFDYRRTVFMRAVVGGSTLQEVIQFSENTGNSIFLNMGKPDSWILYSSGPDKKQNLNTRQDSEGNALPGFGAALGRWPYYDASNGTISTGDIMRSSLGDEASMASR